MFEVVRTTRHFTAVLTPDIFSPPAPEFVVVVWHVGHLPVLLLFFFFFGVWSNRPSGFGTLRLIV